MFYKSVLVDCLTIQAGGWKMVFFSIIRLSNFFGGVDGIFFLWVLLFGLFN